MIKNKILPIITVFILLVLSSFVSAIIDENFQVSGAKEVSVYECSVNQDGMIHVTNTGLISSGYSVSIGGTASKFVSLGPIHFVLDPGQSQDILVYYTVSCGSKGEYDLDIYINTVLDTKKILTQKVVVEKPLNINITPIVYSQKIKPCKTAYFQYNITNIGTFDETYSLVFEKPFGEYTSVNFNIVKLAPGQSVPLDIFIKPSCDIYGNYTIPFTIKTENTNLNAKTFGYLVIDRAYDYTLNLGNVYAYNTTNFSIFAEKNKGEIYSLCSDSNEIIPIKLKNNADLNNTFYLKVDGLNIPNFISLAADSINLTKDQEAIVQILANTHEVEGDFNVTLVTFSKSGQIKKEEQMIFSVDNCYRPSISTLDERNIVLDYNPVKVPLAIINTGSKNADYQIYIKNSGDWLSIEPSSVDVSAGKTGATYIVSQPTNLTKRGVYTADLVVKVKDTNVAYTDSFKITLVTMNMFDKFYYNILLPHIWYFVLGLILLILLIVLLLLLLKKIKNKLNRLKERRALAKQRISKTKSSGKSRRWLWILLLLLGLLLILFGAYMLFKDKIMPSTVSNVTKINQTAVNATNSTILNIWNSISSKTSSIVMDKIWPATKAFFKSYWLYIVIGLLVLLVLLLLIWLIRKAAKKVAIRRRFQKQRQARIVQKTEKIKPSKKVKIRISKKWLFIILGILLLAGLGYLVYYFSAWHYVTDMFARNETETPIMPNITQNITSNATQNITQEPSAIPKAFNWLYEKAGFVLGKIWAFITNNLFYILLALAILVLLLIILLLIRKLIRRRHTTLHIDSADDEIVLKNSYLACGETLIRLKRPVNNVSLSIRKVRKPTFISAGDPVYQYFAIDHLNLYNEDIKEAILRFRVKKSWLRRNHVKRSDISLKRYHNQWTGVNTKIVEEDKKYVYYESILDHLSYFAIVGKRTETQPKKVVVYQKPEKKIKLNLGWIKKLFWPVIIILLLLGLALLVFAFWAVIIAFLIAYLWFILLGIAIIVLFALIPWIIKLVKWSNKKLSKKAKRWLWIILIILLLLALLAWGLSYIIPKISFNLSNVLSVDYNTTNITENISNETVLNQTSQNITFIPNENPASPEEDMPNFEMEAGKNLTINLSRYFIDPDGDKLSYSNSELEHISIVYSGDNATLIPENGFIGSEFVIFTADDGKGGKVDSNIIKLIVAKEKEPASPTKLFILSNRIFYVK